MPSYRKSIVTVNYKKFPNLNSVMRHRIASSETQPGYCATIFIDKPNPDSTGIYFPVEANTVYIQTVEKGDFFRPFDEVANDCVVLSIPMYVALLNYFKESWAADASKVTCDTLLMTSPVEDIDFCQTFFFTGHGRGVLEVSIDTATLGIFRESMQPSGKFFMNLYHNGKTVELCPDTMVYISQFLENLLLHLISNNFIIED